MLRRVYFTVLASLMIPSLLLSPNASATVVLSQDQIEAITSSCITIQRNLQRLQQTDRLLRVNMGQNYDSIARRLMAPLNSRIALNGLDGVNLAKTTVDFNAQFTVFQHDYSKYDDTLSAAMAVNCQQHPVDLYNQIVNARVARQTVYDDTQKLDALLKTYKEQFEAFSAAHLAQSGGR